MVAPVSWSSVRKGDFGTITSFMAVKNVVVDFEDGQIVNLPEHHIELCLNAPGKLIKGDKVFLTKPWAGMRAGACGEVRNVHPSDATVDFKKNGVICTVPLGNLQTYVQEPKPQRHFNFIRGDRVKLNTAYAGMKAGRTGIVVKLCGNYTPATGWNQALVKKMSTGKEPIHVPLEKLDLDNSTTYMKIGSRVMLTTKFGLCKAGFIGIVKAERDDSDMVVIMGEEVQTQHAIPYENLVIIEDDKKEKPAVVHFNKGDRVELIKAWGGMKAGRTGKVADVNPNTNPWPTVTVIEMSRKQERVYIPADSLKVTEAAKICESIEDADLNHIKMTREIRPNPPIIKPKPRRKEVYSHYHEYAGY